MEVFSTGRGMKLFEEYDAIFSVGFERGLFDHVAESV